MPCYMLSHLADATLARDLADVVARERAGTAQVLAHIAEFDARRLYLPAGYPSMFAYCVGALRLSEDAAAKRIQAARTARRFPALFAALAEGRLHLTGVGLLSPYLVEDTAEELLSAATHKTKAEIEDLLARRFPRTDVLAWVTALPGGGPDGSQHAPAHVGCSPPGGQGPGGQGREHAPAHVDPPVPAGASSRLKPLTSQSFAVQFTLSREGHDLLQQAQALLGHKVAAGDIGAVVERGLGLLVRQLERRKYAATATPATRHRRARLDGRHLPADVRRAVWARDSGRCTFVGDSGHRCEARSRLETLWNDGLAVVGSCHLREERPTAWHEATLDRGLAPAAPEPHTKGARRERERYHLRGDGCTQAGDPRGDAAARREPAGRVETGQRARRDPEIGEEAPARGAG